MLVQVAFRNNFLDLLIFIHAHGYMYKIVSSLSNENEDTPTQLLRFFNCSQPGLKFPR